MAAATPRKFGRSSTLLIWRPRPGTSPSICPPQEAQVTFSPPLLCRRGKARSLVSCCATRTNHDLLPRRTLEAPGRTRKSPGKKKSIQARMRASHRPKYAQECNLPKPSSRWMTNSTLNSHTKTPICRCAQAPSPMPQNAFVTHLVPGGWDRIPTLVAAVVGASTSTTNERTNKRTPIAAPAAHPTQTEACLFGEGQISVGFGG